MNKIFVSAIALIACSGCSSTPDKELPVVEENETAHKGLAAQNLTDGDCGLFLWSKTDASTFVFFHRAGETDALIYDDGEVKLSNIANDGVLFEQFYSQSQWEYPDGRMLRLSIEPGEEINGGKRIPGGVISAENKDGWEVKTPVAGVTACAGE